MKAIHILRPGRVVPANGGDPLDLTPDLFRQLAESYDSKVHEAPLVVGHPKTDDVAHGWVKGLRVTEAGLEAEPDQVSPWLSEAVQEGRLKKVSASLYPPEHPANPTPGKWHLRHIGFLGAEPPAVKGLRPLPADFAEDQDGLVELAEPDVPWFMRQVAAAFRSVRDYVIGEKGVEAADKVLAPWTLESLERMATQAEGEGNSLAFAEGGDMSEQEKAALAAKEAEIKAKAAELSAKETSLSEQATEISTREKAVAAKEAEQRKAEAKEFVEGLVQEGKVLPRERAALVEVLSGAPAAATLEFSEGEGEAGKAVSQPAGEFLRGFLKGLPKRVEFAEVGVGVAPLDGDDAEALLKAAQEFQFAERKAGREVSITEAVDHVKGGAK